MLPRKAGKAGPYIAVEYANKVESADLKMAGEMRDWQIKCVCASCNNGWMSQLDAAAAPIMKPLILRRRKRLSAKDCCTIATWSVLKSMVVHHRIVRHTRRKKLKTDRKPPKGWSVWIANYKRGKWKSEWLSRPFTIDSNERYYRRRPGRPTASNSHVTVQIIKNLFIHVVNCPLDDFPFRWTFRKPDGSLLSGDVVRIWPTSDISILWPPKALIDFDAQIAGNALIRGLRRIPADIRSGKLPPP